MKVVPRWEDSEPLKSVTRLQVSSRVEVHEIKISDERYGTSIFGGSRLHVLEKFVLACRLIIRVVVFVSFLDGPLIPSANASEETGLVLTRNNYQAPDCVLGCKALDHRHQVGEFPLRVSFDGVHAAPTLTDRDP